MTNSVELSSALLQWWEQHGRRRPAQKPWMHRSGWSWSQRHEDLDPYPIWIAEVMLQQTQLQVALPYWKRWMQCFADVSSLAMASEQDVLSCWQGLGYYARARRLRQAAQHLDGHPWPRTLEEWVALPGIGRSTAASILSSAFNLPFAILDGNVKRVLARVTAFPESPTRHRAHFWSLSESVLDPTRPRDCNQALMDLGATVCTPRNPVCSRCPWVAHCAAYDAGSPSCYPVKDAPKPIPFQVIGVGVVLNSAGEVLIDQRLNEGLLGGLWEFPGGKQEPREAIEITVARELREELGIEVEVAESLIQVDHSYSHKRLRFEVFWCHWLSGQPQPLASQQVRWVKPSELNNFPFPTANLKIIAAIQGSLLNANRSC